MMSRSMSRLGDGLAKATASGTAACEILYRSVIFCTTNARDAPELIIKKSETVGVFRQYVSATAEGTS
jgi:hypothetical protein